MRLTLLFPRQEGVGEVRCAEGREGVREDFARNSHVPGLPPDVCWRRVAGTRQSPSKHCSSAARSGLGSYRATQSLTATKKRFVLRGRSRAGDTALLQNPSLEFLTSPIPEDFVWLSIMLLSTINLTKGNITFLWIVVKGRQFTSFTYSTDFILY